MIRNHNTFFTRTIPFAITKAAGDLLQAFDRKPMEARPQPKVRIKPVVKKTPLHTYRVLEARRRRAVRRANRR